MCTYKIIYIFLSYSSKNNWTRMFFGSWQWHMLYRARYWSRGMLLHHRPVQLCRIFRISRDQVLSATRTSTHIVTKTNINKLFPWTNHENKFLPSRIPKKFVFSDVTKPLPREGRQGGLRWLFSNFPILHLCIFSAKFLSSHVGFSSQICCFEARFL